MIGGGRQRFNTDYTLENGRGKRVMGGRRDNSRAIYQVYSLGQGYVLPDFSLARDRCNLADFPAFQSIDDATLAHVRIPDESNGYLFLVRMKTRELAE